MTLLLAAVLAWSYLLASGCDDASLRIRFDVPAPYDDAVDTVVLRVLVPPGDPALAFDCDAVAFHEVTAETLALSQVQEVVAGRDGIGLSGIPRTGHKLFWLEARDADNQSIAAGCAPVDDISGDDSVTVIGEPTKIAAFRGIVDGGFVNIGQELPASLELTVTDTAGVLLEGVAVEWHVIGLAGKEMASGQGSTSDRGAAQITIANPGQIPGPSLLDVGVRWERTPLPLLGGFGQLGVLLDGSLPGDASSDLGDVATSNLYVAGRIGPAGEMGFVALGPTRDPLGEGRTVLAAYHDPGAGTPPFRLVTSVQPVRGQNVAMATITRGNREIAMVATSTALSELTVEATRIDAVNHPAPGPLPVAMVSAGPCQGNSEVLVIALASMTGPITFSAIDSTGQAVASPFTQSLAPSLDRIVGAGCAAGLSAQPSRVLVYGGRGGQTGSDDSPIQVVVTGDGTRRTAQWLNFAPMAGFTPSLAGEPARLLGVVIDIQGATLSRYDLAPVGNGQLELQEATSDDLFTFARTMQGGDFDGDGRVDLAVVMDFGNDELERNRSRLQIILGATYQGQRIVGVSDERRLRDPHLLVADFDGDGASDILLADRSEYTIIRGVRP